MKMKIKIKNKKDKKKDDDEEEEALLSLGGGVLIWLSSFSINKRFAQVNSLFDYLSSRAKRGVLIIYLDVVSWLDGG